MSRRYPKEFHDFMSGYIPGHTSKEVAEEANRLFAFNMTAELVKAYKHNHKIRSGTPCGYTKGQPTKVYPKEIQDFIRANYKGIGPKQMAEILNEKFGTNYRKGQIKGYYGKNKLDSGVDYRFKKGHAPKTPFPKGSKQGEKYRFKPGNIPANVRPMFSIRKDNYGYYEIKVREHPDPENGIRSCFEKLHKYLWEQANGPLKKGEAIVFLDGNKENCVLSNLAKVTRAELAKMNQNHLISDNPEATKAGINVAKLIIATEKAKSRRRKK